MPGEHSPDALSALLCMMDGEKESSVTCIKLPNTAPPPPPLQRWPVDSRPVPDSKRERREGMLPLFPVSPSFLHSVFCLLQSLVNRNGAPSSSSSSRTRVVILKLAIHFMH